MISGDFGQIKFIFLENLFDLGPIPLGEMEMY